MNEVIKEALMIGSKELVKIGATPMLVNGFLAVKYEGNIMTSSFDTSRDEFDEAIIKLYKECPIWEMFFLPH